MSTETWLLGLWLESSSSIEGRFCASFCLAVRTQVKTVNVTRYKKTSHNNKQPCRVGLVFGDKAASPGGQAGTPELLTHFIFSSHQRPKGHALVLCVNCPWWHFINSTSPNNWHVRYTWTLRHLNFCTAGYVQHEVIMHTCNIFYFHMRFKCFFYSLASFFFLAWNARERRKNVFHKRYLHLVLQ